MTFYISWGHIEDIVRSTLNTRTMRIVKCLSIAILTTFLWSCNDDPDHYTDLPDCVQSIVDDTPQIIIKSQEIDNSVRYWLNTGANALDGDEYIVSSSCDTLCYYGGWVNPDCIDEYDSEGWTQVWP